MSENKTELKPGIVLNSRYTIRNVIGIGGFGITYQAFDMGKNSVCAVKEFMPSDIVYRLPDGKNIQTISDSKNALFEHGKDRFLEEAEILQKLNTVRSVVSVYDFFQENGTCYFVMEYLDGLTLSNLVKQKGGYLPLEVVLDVVREVGKALIQVHSYNIFHRDISPDNIFVTSKGEIKLIDFGNAKNLIRNDNENLSVVLKPGYAPLEQYTSSGTQGRFTDVYSLASTAYYIMTGIKVPDALDRCKNNSYTPLKEMGFPGYISDAIDNALKLKYKDRTQTIDELLDNLRLAEHKKIESRKRKKVPVLEVISGELLGKRYIVPMNTNIVLGRDPSVSQLVFNDGHISKKHCEIYYDEPSGQFFVLDSSTNGSYIDGKRLVKGKIFTVKSGFVLSLSNECSIKVGVIYER